MPKRAKKIIQIDGKDVIADESYYLNNSSLPKAESTYTYTREMVEDIRKCREDIVYFAEKFFYINGYNGKEIISLFPKQKKILKTIQNNKKILLLTSRQFSKTTLMTIMAIWSAIFFPDQTVVIVANKQSTATEIFNRVRLAFLQMENWLKGGVEEFNKTFFTLSNGSRIITSATSPDAIRGLAVDVLLLDEFAIIPPKVAEEFWAAVTPTLATRFNNNKNAKLIVASTPKGIGNKFHDLVTKAEAGKNDFKVEKAMWYEFPGRDEAWKTAEIATMGSLDLFEQEYECKFLNNSGSPFDPSMFNKFEEEMKDPINILEDGNYLIWAKPDPDHIYTMGVDTSEGVGQDFSVIQIFDITDPINIEQVATYASNKIDTTTWASKVLKIAKEWYSPVLLVERNGAGTTPCDKLFNEWNYPRFINYGYKEAGKLREGRRFIPGVLNHSNTKNLAITNMKYYIHDRRCVKIYDKETINELRTFIRVKSTAASGHYKWKAQEGFHDDRVMAMCWSLFTLHSNIINEWLIVKEKNGDNIPLKLDKRWTFNAQRDFDDSLYKNMQETSPFIGVIAIKGQNNYNILNDPRIANRDKLGTLEHLLNYGEYIPLGENDNYISLPNSFNNYEVKQLY